MRVWWSGVVLNNIVSGEKSRPTVRKMGVFAIRCSIEKGLIRMLAGYAFPTTVAIPFLGLTV